ncbi:MAG: aminopeptidase N C-terminal domain-containing protein [Limnobacter sp.]|nr:aminopeptidase N C-terminal domain-containing protein [Limnobacter sp.]
MLAAHFAAELESTYQQCQHTQAYAYNALAAGQRALKNLLLAFISSTENPATTAQQQFERANNMTDTIGALTPLVHQSKDPTQALQSYYEQFQHAALAIDKWFTVQATRPASCDAPVLAHIRALLKHPAFTLKNPNRARSVLGAFALQNPSVFHSHSGEGYQLWAEHVIALDALNPQVAARLARALDRWPKLIAPLQTKAKEALQSIARATGLSTDVLEIVSKALGNP